jgi:hypothetical protein
VRDRLLLSLSAFSSLNSDVSKANRAPLTARCSFHFLLGWLLTSLGLIGSPASLASHVSDGVRAFVHHAIHPSPGGGAFNRIRQLGTGTHMFAQHMAGGTLDTVVNVAKNFGRNIERLSFDTEHRAFRTEARRRSAPGFGAGVVQGLQGKCARMAALACDSCLSVMPMFSLTFALFSLI